MKTLNVQWKLIGLGTLAVIVTVWTGSRMEARTGQNPTGKSVVSPQAREADEVGIIIQGGITHGQTLRFDLFHSAEAECRGQDQMRLTLFDSQGHVLAQSVIPTGPNQTSHFEVNADQLAQTVFDNNGRAELTAVLGHLNSGGVPGGGCVVAGEVFDNNTGSTIAHIAGVSLLAGVWIDDDATGNVVQNNFIGTDHTGTLELENLNYGVYIANCSNNTIGGGSGLGNTIAFNGFVGMRIVVDSGTPTTGNAILTNSIFSNIRLGIDLGTDEVTPNDPLDADAGPNNRQNFPVLTSAISNTGNNTTTMIGSLDSTPSSTFTLQFFFNPSCDPLGNGEGKTYLGSTTVTTTIDGSPTSFIVAFPLTVPVGQAVTATATNNSTRDTSEFSACKTVSGDSPTAVDDPVFAADAYDDGVLLHWQTGLEVNNLGFNVYRDESGKLSLVNSQLIAGSAFLVGSDITLGSGHSYQWWDDAPASKSTTYWLEDRDINGQSGWHGPFHIDQIATGQLPPSVHQEDSSLSLKHRRSISTSRDARTTRRRFNPGGTGAITHRFIAGHREASSQTRRYISRRCEMATKRISSARWSLHSRSIKR